MIIKNLAAAAVLTLFAFLLASGVIHVGASHFTDSEQPLRVGAAP